jgi:hypothetical protein
VNKALVIVFALPLLLGCVPDLTSDHADAARSSASDAGASSHNGKTPDAGCPTTREATTTKLTPPEGELRQQVGDRSVEFVVLMKDELNLPQLPFPMVSRDAGPGDDPAIVAREESNAATQACARAEVEALGGEYVSTFWQINAFVARLTANAAVTLSGRSDVRVVEVSETDAGPP